MPLLKPNPDESRSEFVSRFLSDRKMLDEFPDIERRLAIAYERWNKFND